MAEVIRVLILYGCVYQLVCILFLESTVFQFSFNSTSPILVDEKMSFSMACMTDPYIYEEVVIKMNDQQKTVHSSVHNKTRIVTYSVKSAKLSDNGTYECLALSTRTGKLKKIAIDVLVKGLYMNNSSIQLHQSMQDREDFLLI